MELTHEFTVPASVEETWTALTDIEGVAGCFPGATVNSVEGDSFKGTVKVKLGPISLTYNGSGEFTGKDDATHTMTLAAKGKDRRGNGTAGADVTASMEPDGEGTRVKVVTDLQITGKPAQFGRGVIQDVSDKLLGQFTDCLAKRLSGPAPEPEAAAAAAPEAAAAAAPDAAAAAGQDAGSASQPTGGDQDAGPALPSGGDQDAGPASQPAGAAAAPSPAADQDAGPASVGAPAAEQVTPISSAPSAASSAGSSAASSTGAAASSAAGAASSAASSVDEPLDLGATLLPILVKNYGKQLGAGVGVLVFLLLLRRLLRR